MVTLIKFGLVIHHQNVVKLSSNQLRTLGPPVDKFLVKGMNVLCLSTSLWPSKVADVEYLINADRKEKEHEHLLFLVLRPQTKSISIN